MCLWCGIIKIIENTHIILILEKALKPILRLLYKDAQNDKKAMKYISINTVSNVIGIRKCFNTLWFKGNGGNAKE